MKKLKHVSIFVCMLVFLFLLSGCSDNGSGTVNLENENNTKNQEVTYEGTIDIGSIFYSNNRFDYVYGGIVNESIVINAHKSQAERASNLVFYIPITRTEEVPLPYNDSTSIKLKSVDKTKGTAEITLTTKENK